MIGNTLATINYRFDWLNKTFIIWISRKDHHLFRVQINHFPFHRTKLSFNVPFNRRNEYERISECCLNITTVFRIDLHTYKIQGRKIVATRSAAFGPVSKAKIKSGKATKWNKTISRTTITFPAQKSGIGWKLVTRYLISTFPDCEQLVHPTRWPFAPMTFHRSDHF